jgi:SPP1 family predicted phage head-tail adaptor
MATSIGRLRSKVDLQTSTDTRDAGGGLSCVFETTASIFADIRPQSGDETYRQGKVQEKLTHKIFIRYRTGVKATQRILFENRVFNIRSIINVDERDRFLELKCVEGESH